MSVEHYENFPVASVLCPPALRPAVVAIYRFARCGDDIADEGEATPAERLSDLAAYRDDLRAALAGLPTSARWRSIFDPLAQRARQFSLRGGLLHELLDAFEQDVRNPRYPDRVALLDYCRRSANPVGRLLLGLYGINDPAALRQSDGICTALQLINFWQDLGVDTQRGRHYVPLQDLARHGIDANAFTSANDTPRSRALVRELCGWAREMMLQGAPLVHRLPGRAGWELRLVVQGGLRVLDKIAANDHAALSHRPTLGASDAPLLLWRAARMTRP